LSPAKKRTASSDPADAPLVLIVEDNEDARDLYAMFLELAGLRTEAVATAEEGLTKAFAEAPDVIIMDLSLPDMDGAKATERLKADPRTRDVPVVVVTGEAVPARLNAATEAGADAVYTKPLLPHELLERLMPFLAKPSDTTPPPEERTTATRRRKK
jgi:CheY-like chemotaxis protein